MNYPNPNSDSSDSGSNGYCREAKNGYPYGATEPEENYNIIDFPYSIAPDVYYNNNCDGINNCIVPYSDNRCAPYIDDGIPYADNVVPYASNDSAGAINSQRVYIDNSKTLNSFDCYIPQYKGPEYIANKSKRSVTFSKRKRGLMKKAYELGKLTGSEILLVVVNEANHVFTYTTESLMPVLNCNSQSIINSIRKTRKGRFSKKYQENN